MQKINKCYTQKEYLYNNWVILKKSQAEIAKENEVTLGVIEYYIKKNNLIKIRNKSKYLFESPQFKLDDKVYCHLLGFIAADGYIYSKHKRVDIMIASKDIDLLKFYKDYFKIPNPIKEYKIKNIPERKVLLSIRSDVLIEHLTSLGINIKDKTCNLQFPYQLSEFSMKWFLRGFIDGDGNFHKNGVRFICLSINFVKDFILFLNKKFNLNYTITYQKGKTKFYPKFEVCSYKAYKFLDWLYEDREFIGLKRKLITVFNILK